MAAYGNLKVKVMIHPGNPGEEDGAVGTMARDIKDYIATLDSTNNEVLSIRCIFSHIKFQQLLYGCLFIHSNWV